MAIKNDGQSSAQTDLGLPVDKSEEGSSFNTILSNSSGEHSPELTTTDPSSDGYPDSPTLGTPRGADDVLMDEARDDWGPVDERARHIVKGNASVTAPNHQGMCLSRAS